jgi:Uncharacterized small protein containing a coiled-coil domain
MSSIKNTQVDGDVSVGRNVAVGGGIIAQGGSRFKGSVKVDGWLEAKNIKGANKGLFSTVEKLRSAYPLPHDGWWAIVGGSLPGPIFIADGGAWVATGMEGGNPSVELDDIGELKEDVSSLQKDIADVEAELEKKANSGGASGTLKDSEEAIKDITRDYALKSALNALLEVVQSEKEERASGDEEVLRNALFALGLHEDDGGVHIVNMPVDASEDDMVTPGTIYRWEKEIGTSKVFDFCLMLVFGTETSIAQIRFRSASSIQWRSGSPGSLPEVWTEFIPRDNWDQTNW